MGLLHAYAKGDSEALEQILEGLAEEANYLAHCSEFYGETDEIVMEVSARYFSKTGQPERAIRIINMFIPFIDEKVKARWLAARDDLSGGGTWPSRVKSWDGTYSTASLLSPDLGYTRLTCGGHGEEYGLILGDGNQETPWRGETGKAYTLGLRSVTWLIGYGWPYRVVIEYGDEFAGFAEAAEALCGEL